MLELCAIVALVGIAMLVAGIWVFRTGSRKGGNLQRLAGVALLIAGLVVAVPSAAILIVFYLWATGGSYYGSV